MNFLTKYLSFKFLTAETQGYLRNNPDKFYLVKKFNSQDECVVSCNAETECKMITYLTRFKTCFFYNNTIKNAEFNSFKILKRDNKYSFFSKLSDKNLGIS